MYYKVARSCRTLPDTKCAQPDVTGQYRTHAGQLLCRRRTLPDRNGPPPDTAAMGNGGGMPLKSSNIQQ
jgi:hypothetical protein